MNQGQKIITVSLWAVLVLVMVGVIGAGAWDRLRDNRARPAPSSTRPAGESLDTLWPAPPFALTDQNDKPVSDQSLHGHPYIASFIFTQCAGPCPLITAKVAELQKSLRSPAVQLISFSVDPDHDTPAVLKEYAEKFHADPARWHFLTGKPQAIYAVAAGMKVSAQPADAMSPIIHSTQLLLVDADGKVRGIYNTGEHSDPETLNRLAHDADLLAEGKLK